MPRSSMAVRTGTSGISSSRKSCSLPDSTSSGPSTSCRRQVTSASSQAYSATFSTGTSAIVICFWPVPISALVGILVRSK